MQPDLRDHLKWWGWGERSVRFQLHEYPDLIQYLRDRLQVRQISPAREFSFDNLSIPAQSLPVTLLKQLKALVGEAHLDVSDQTRFIHSFGRSYRDIIRLRSLKVFEAPDAIVFPGSAEEVAGVVDFCAQNKIAVVPWGGGTSVVGGLEPLRGQHPFLVVINLARMNKVLTLDPISHTAHIEAGALGPHLEAQLAERGFFLGHYPQSFEYSTLGGWLATRSSGQNSLGYGSIRDMMVSLEVVFPGGGIRTMAVPNHACGPDINQILVGSEGTLGIITSALMKVRPIPACRRYHMFLFENFTKAAEASRRVVQTGIKPAMIRVSDEDETEANLILARRVTGPASQFMLGAMDVYLACKGYPRTRPASAVIVGAEGSPKQTQSTLKTVRDIFGTYDAADLGPSPGRKWLKHRFFLPYVRDDFIDNGVFVETLETATEWSNLEKLHQAVRSAVLAVGKKDSLPYVVYTHVSHLYEDGASLYFSILARARDGHEQEQWHDVKEAASRAIRENGGIISHHHGVGVDHRFYLHWGKWERKLVTSLKNSIDPHRILNPGKLLE